jgi:hypothetical protein
MICLGGCRGLEEQIDKQGFDLGPVPGDAMIAGRLGPAQLEPVEGAFAGQRRTILAPCGQLSGQHRHRRVVAQLVMIDQIFIAQRNPEAALPDHGADLILGQLGGAAIGETFGKPLDQSDPPIRRS